MDYDELECVGPGDVTCNDFNGCHNESTLAW